ncbi:hypothetical protein F5Y12DRAFT_414216 [Xylaria sp. FL1777]|nr:hypothetical protein F5Y12DRAFT_414216 [Xylaria sp. FL1777]
MAVALIIGVGEAVGRASAEKFAAAGYKVAVASRTQRLDSSKFPFFQFDAAEPTHVPALFEKVHKQVGIPEVVIYNAFASPRNRLAVFDIVSPESFQKSMNVNAISAAITAHETVKGFLELESQGKLGSGGGTFLYTGNALNDKPLSGLLSLAIGKSTSAATIQYLALTAYNDKPFRFVPPFLASLLILSLAVMNRIVVLSETGGLYFSSFYYVDERQPNGGPMYKGATADPHADVFLQLAQDPKQGPWQYTFSKENGYTQFPRDFPEP